MSKHLSNIALVSALLSAGAIEREPEPTTIVGATLDDIIGLAMGAGSVDDELAMILSGDNNAPAIGFDDIVGAAVKQAASGNTHMLQQLALLKAAGQRGVVQKSAEDLKWELLPIPLTTLAAGATQQVAVRGIRSQRLDELTFPSSNIDHQFIALLSVEINGVQQLNGSGGVLLSQLSEMNTRGVLRGSTAQTNQDVIFTFQNVDAVNARTLRGTMGGPTLRVG
jgi:hypothetical protein